MSDSTDQVDEMLSEMELKQEMCEIIKGSESCFLFYDNDDGISYIPFNMTAEACGWLNCAVMSVMQDLMAIGMDDEEEEG